VRNLETSQRFVAPRLASEAAQTQEGNRSAGGPQMIPGAVEFEIFSGYNPLPAAAVKKVKDSDDAQDEDEAAKSVNRRGRVKAIRPNKRAQTGGAR
jgi:type IV pilus assembly protein PilN